MALFRLELLLHSAVEEERDVRILLRLCMHINTETYHLRSFVLTSNVGLLDALFSEPLSKDVGHGLRRERDGEGEFLVVAGHGGDMLRSHVSLGLNPRRELPSLTRFFGMSTSIGLSGRPKTDEISRIRSER